ncbi:MAG: TrkH family potassium uptake protein [Acidobacteria bacterium]|nr:MAG: TrkH family potassium uptake protein [Acidobacteriota bacterium]
MNLRQDLRIVGFLAWLLGGFLLLPLALALAFGEPAGCFAGAIALALLLGLAGWLAGRGSRAQILVRDGFLVVTTGWITVSLLGAVPYVLAGRLGPIDAIFESVSGFTTTGSSVLTDIEAWPASLLFWRALTQWIGGMGIILFTIAVLPVLGVGGMQLFKAEAPGPVTDKLAPRLSVTARYLWGTYVGLTAAEVLLLVLGGMPLLEAVDHAFTTMATGGFSPRNASIAAYPSSYIHWVVILFMFLASVNFVIHFRIATGRWREALRDEELHWYVLMVLFFAGTATAVLVAEGQAIGQAVEDAFFTVVSLISTTGYSTADFERWPPVLHALIFPILAVGGMAGSTAGGFKTLRTLIAFRALRMSFRRMIHPHAVTPVVYRGNPVPRDVLAAIWGFFALYLTLAAAGTLVLGAAGADPETAWSATLTAMAGIGPGLGGVGPTDNFAWLAGYAKLALSGLMLAGRLELYTLILVFLPGFWRR